MTIARGQEWGHTVPRPSDLVVAASDAELAQVIVAEPLRPVTLAGGDLFRTVGSPGLRDPVQLLPCDALAVTVDDREFIAVAHVVARGRARWSWWSGPIIAVMNADHVGAWNVAPRAHPNDGRFDVVEVSRSMSLRARWQARARLSQGTHVPHPDVTVRTATAAEWTFARSLSVRIDDVEVGPARRLAVRIVPDHFAIHV